MGLINRLFGRTWQAFLERGDSHAIHGDLGRALGEYEDALERVENDANASDEDRASVRKKYNRTCEKVFQKHMAEATAYAEDKAFQRAIEFYTLALEFAPTEAKHTEILERIASLEDTQEKQTPTRKVKDISPQANDLEDATDFEASDEVQAFQAVLATIEPEHAKALEDLGSEFRKGYLAMMEGDARTAIKYIKPIYRKNQENIYLKYEMARLFIAEKKYKQASDLIASASKQAPNLLILKHAQIEVFWGLEQYDRAERAVEDAFRIDDEELENFRYAAETCLRSGEFENGVDLVNAALVLHPKTTDLYTLRGRLEEAQQNFAQALESYETSLSMRWQYDPETGSISFDSNSAFRAANLYIQRETNAQRAEELFQALLTLDDPQSRWAFLKGLGHAMKLQGKIKLAQSAWIDALAALPNNARVEQKEIQRLLSSLKAS